MKKYILFSLIAFVFFGCKEEAEKPSVKTASISNITHNSAAVGGVITSVGDDQITSKGVVWSTLQNPTIKINQGIINKGGGENGFTCYLVGLTQNTTYYVRAYATNSSGTEYGEQLNFTTFSPDGPGATVTDIDGNTYNTVWINYKQWMKENLKTTKFNNGTEIQLVTDNTAWKGLTSSAYCWYDNNVSNKDTYGALYTWYTVNTNNLCPTGWHVPTDEEWYNLEAYVDITIVNSNWMNMWGARLNNSCGKKLKSTTGWLNFVVNSGNGTDSYAFSALPSGFRWDDGSFSNVGKEAAFWCKSTDNSYYLPIYKPIFRAFFNSGNYSYRDRSYFNAGLSVRCVKD